MGMGKEKKKEGELHKGPSEWKKLGGKLDEKGVRIVGNSRGGGGLHLPRVHGKPIDGGHLRLGKGRKSKHGSKEKKKDGGNTEPGPKKGTTLHRGKLSLQRVCWGRIQDEFHE